jgi:hypothetical protein
MMLTVDPDNPLAGEVSAHFWKATVCVPEIGKIVCTNTTRRFNYIGWGVADRAMSAREQTLCQFDDMSALGHKRTFALAVQMGRSAKDHKPTSLIAYACASQALYTETLFLTGTGWSANISAITLRKVTGSRLCSLARSAQSSAIASTSCRSLSLLYSSL